MIIIGIIVVISLPLMWHRMADAHLIDSNKLNDETLHSQTLDVIVNHTNAFEDSSQINVDKLMPLYPPVPISIYSDLENFHINTIYIANSGSNTVSVIDAKNNTNIKNIKVGISPAEIFVDSFYIIL